MSKDLSCRQSRNPSARRSPLGTPGRPEAQSGLTVRPAGKVQCQGGRTKPYRPHLHWPKPHLWGNTISQLLGFQTHTQDMHQSLFCIGSLSTNLGTLKRKIPFHNISLLNYTGKISWLTWTTPNCTFSFCQNFLNHWKCYRVMTLLIWISFSEIATKISKNFVVTLQVQNYCHKYALQADKLWLQ